LGRTGEFDGFVQRFGAMSAPFGHTIVPPSMKNRWK
jgi:hypothetical protein